MHSRTVLWGARSGDVQVGSREDDRQQAAARRQRALYAQRVAYRELGRTVGRAYAKQVIAAERAGRIVGRAYADWCGQVQRDLERVLVGER